ncbi:hypothetical protein M885DRAFT_581048, partial [Pelagophyceae sp. CCMP2097]
FLDDDAAALRAKLPKKTVKTDEQKRAAKQATDKARKDKLRQELQGLHVGGRGPRLVSYLESADFTLGGELKIGRLFSSRQEASLVMIEACERLPGGGSCVASGAVHPLSQVKPVTGIAQLTGVCASPTCGFVFDVKRQNAAVDGGSGKWKLVKAVLHDHACGRLRTTSIAADANAPAASAKSRKDNARCVYGAGVLVRVVVEANSSSKTSFKPESVKLLITASAS